MTIRELLDLVAPRECACCHRPGLPWCQRCTTALARVAFAGGPARVAPSPTPPHLPPTFAWGVYADPLSSAIVAWKDAGRRDLVRQLGPMLTQAAGAAVSTRAGPDAPVLIVPAPSSRSARRHRGDAPLLAMAAHVTRGLALSGCDEARLAPALHHARRVADQAGLGSVGRIGNVRGAMIVDPLWDKVIRGRRCLVVDDIITTGSTMAEAARALRAAGAAEVLGATVAATRRRVELLVP